MNTRKILNLFNRSKNLSFKKEEKIKKIFSFKNKNFHFSIKIIFIVMDQIGQNMKHTGVRILNLDNFFVLVVKRRPHPCACALTLYSI